MSSIKTFFRHCPNCGRRFEIRLVGKKLEDEESHVEEKIPSPMYASVRVPTVLSVGRTAIVDVEEFQYTYKCKACGHQWSEVREKEYSSEVPTGYTGD